MNVNPEQMPPESWSDYRTLADNRDEIAILIWRIVAAFTGDSHPLAIEPGQAYWEVAERYISDHAGAAEQHTIVYRDRQVHPATPGALVRQRQDVIMEVLGDLSLADDYLRIKRDEQHLSFDGD